MSQTIFVTGAAGYVGSVLVGQLLGAGYHVTGYDNLSFGGDALLAALGHPHFRFQVGDIRDNDAVAAAIKGSDAVVHLAAIVGDPACRREPELAEEVNGAATLALLDRCERTGSVKRFIFASTCSNYGKMNGEEFVNEDSPLRPISLYARLKVEIEELIIQRASDAPLAATSLRFATVHGLSPRTRFDLTVNEFTREVVLGRMLEIFGEKFWRPYCHVRDVARACQLVLESDPEHVSSRVFGVGSTAENYQKETLARMLKELEPSADIRMVPKEEDPRDYRVDFTKIQQELGFKPRWTVSDAIREIADAVRKGIISDPDALHLRNT